MIFEHHLRAIQAAIPDMVTEMITDARNFFDQSWSRKAFPTESGLQTWAPVMDRRKGGYKERPLVESGRLRRSLRTEVTPTGGRVFTEVPYAQIHNEGGTITGSVYVRAHTYRTRSGKQAQRRAHTRSVNTSIPQRQFMGHSPELEAIHTATIERTLKAITQ